jgi:hypothetical protein
MSGPATPVNMESEPAVRNYLLLCLTAQAVMVLVLLQHGLRWPSLLVPFIGLAGLTVRWRTAPVFTIMTLAGLLYWQGRQQVFTGSRSRGPGTFNLEDWILCGATLAYLAAHYRYLALTTSIFPTDKRRRRFQDEALASGAVRLPEPAEQRRSPRLVSPSEVGWLVLSLPTWAFIVQLLWKMLPPRPEGMDLTQHSWRGLLLMWIVAVVAFLTAIFLAYVRLQQMSSQEARLFLQDALWLETHREQRTINRWLAWARRRRERAGNSVPGSSESNVKGPT